MRFNTTPVVIDDENGEPTRKNSSRQIKFQDVDADPAGTPKKVKSATKHKDLHSAAKKQTPKKDVPVPMPYDKENLPLRPLLKKVKNVEDNVHTMRLQEDNYLMVNEDAPDQRYNVSAAAFHCE